MEDWDKMIVRDTQEFGKTKKKTKELDQCFEHIEGLEEKVYFKYKNLKINKDLSIADAFENEGWPKDGKNRF